MRNRLFIVAAIAGIAAATMPAAAQGIGREARGEAACTSAEPIGRFDPARDLLIANYDMKTDVDDLHSAAALATVLADPAFACVEAVAVAGAYGDQGGDFVPAPSLFDIAFGDGWLDAHQDHDGAVAMLASFIVARLIDGGDVWIAEAGQSNVSAAAILTAMETTADLDYAGSVHIVQHSDWNEEVTNPDDLAFVRDTVDYIRIADGNGPGNGTPGFRTESGAFWPALLGDPVVGPLWGEAKRLADENNPPPGYVNGAVEAGGMDFSDTAEIAWIFGFEDMAGTEEFVARFAGAGD